MSNNFATIQSNLISQLQSGELSASIPGKTAIFYSGKTNTSTPNWESALTCQQLNPSSSYRIEDTQVGNFITALDDNSAVNGLTEDEIQQLWKDASSYFAQQAQGPVIAIVESADPAAVFGTEELPNLLNNNSVSTINGVDKSNLVGLSTSQIIDILGATENCFDDDGNPPNGAPVTTFPDLGGATSAPSPTTDNTLAVDTATFLGILGLGAAAVGGAITFQPEVVIPALAGLIAIAGSASANPATNSTGVNPIDYQSADQDLQGEAVNSYLLTAIAVVQQELPVSVLATFTNSNISIDNLNTINSSGNSTGDIYLDYGNIIDMAISQENSGEFGISFSGSGKEEFIESSFTDSTIVVGASGSSIQGQDGSNLLVGLGKNIVVNAGSGPNNILVNGDSATINLSQSDNAQNTPINNVIQISGTGDVVNVSGTNSDNIIIGGSSLNTFNIDANYSATPNNITTNIIWGGGGQSTYNFTGRNNIEIVHMNNPTAASIMELSSQDFTDSEFDFLENDGINGTISYVPLTIIIDPSQNDVISLDSTTLVGGPVHHLDYGFSVEYHEDANGYDYYQGSIGEYNNLIISTTTSTSGTLPPTSSDDAIQITNIVNGNLGITLTGDPYVIEHVDIPLGPYDPEYFTNTALYTVASGSDGDTLSGGGGNNLLVGSGSVTYDVGSGDGVVTVYSTPGGASGVGGVVSLDSSFAPGAVTVATAGPANTYDDITIANGNGDEVDLEAARSATAAPITQVDFSDGTVWTYAQLLAMVAAAHVIDSHGTVTSETGNGDGDTFIYNQGYGSLQINVTQVGSFTNVLSLGTGITQSGITVSGDANGDVLITDGTSGDQVNLAGMALYPGDGVQLVQFADGSSLTAAQLIALSLQGTTGADSLYGTSGADIFDGLGAPAGTSDYEQGNGGADTFIYNQGYGQLVINEIGFTTDASVLKLGAGITAANIHLSGDGAGDLILTDDTSGDQVTVENYLSESSEGAGPQEIAFADGTVLDQAQVVLAASTGTTGADVLYGTPGADVFDGRGAPAGSEDLVYGQGGTDTFIFNAGYGQLEINENNGLGVVANTTAVLQLGAGITLSDLRATADSSGDLFITDGTAGDLVEIDELLNVNFFGTTQYGVAQIQFADGTTIDRQQIVGLLTTGTAAADTLSLPASAASANSAVFDGKGAPAGSQDYEQGVSGADTFIFNAGYGQLEINENAGYHTNASVLQFGTGITAAELTATSTAQGDLILSDGTAGDSIQIDGVASRFLYYTSEYGVATARFADGTTLTIQQLRALSTIGTTGADNLYGAPGYGTVGVDIFDGKGAPAGSEDYEQGDGGNDTFIYDQGYGQLEINEMGYTGDDSVLQLGAGITEANIHVTVDTVGDVFLTDGTAGDQIELDQIDSSQIPQGAAYGPETISFAGGSTLTQAQLIAMIAPAGNTITGSSGADTLTGTSGADVFDGQGAPAGSEDYEQGNGGADTFLYNQGYGQLEINEDESAGQSSTLVLGAGIDTTDIGVFADNSGNIYVVDGTGANQVILDGEQNSATSGVQSIIFADGTTWTRAQLIAQETIGTPGPDQIYGTGPGEVFDGKGGGDYEQGDGGGDTFIYNAGYGQLEINEVDTTATPDNVLLFGAGITAGVLHVSEDGSGNVYINDGTTANQVTLNGELNGAGDGVQFVDFADGTVWTKAQLEAIATTGLDPITGTTAADTLYGTNGADLFDGQGAPAGSEDYEQGNGGADTFLYDAGYGQLEINEDESSGQSSTLVFGAGIDTTDIGVFADNSGNIYVVDGTGANQIILDGEQSSASSGVQSIVFADGTTWTRTQLIAQETIGTPGPDQIYGTGPGEVFDGKGGGDYEQGDGGGDTFIYNATYGQLEINEVDTSAHPDNVLLLGAGITPGILDVSDDSAGNIYINNGTSSSQVTLDGEMNGTQYGVQSVVFSDGATWSQAQLYAMATTGTTGNNSIYGTPGADVIDGKGGTDYEQGNGGGDTYVFNAGYGQLTIDNATTAGTTPSGELELGTGLTSSSIWFTQSGTDLDLQVLGSSDHVDVSGWFGTNASSALSEIVGGDGLKIDSGLSQLISAMATYETAHPTFNPATATTMPPDTTLQTAIAAAWHH